MGGVGLAGVGADLNAWNRDVPHGTLNVGWCCVCELLFEFD